MIDPVAEQLLLEISPNLRSIISNNLLHEFFEMDYPYDQKIMKVFSLWQIPDQRTFDRRFKTISTDIRTRIATMTRFLYESMTSSLPNRIHYLAIDSGYDDLF